ncbi:MAG: tRNA pseudouridine(38-40) synthase TruA [Bacteroidota bacterium]
MHDEARDGTFRIAVEYDGTGFSGWQRQTRERTVQGELEAALERIVGMRVTVNGAGRTDAGCHAAGQVASFTARTRLQPDRLRAALNAHLPHDVRVVEAAMAPPGFHARFRAMRRSYRYLIVPEPSALWRRHAWARRTKAGAAALNEATAPLLGEHDFTTFSRQGGDEVSPRCRVSRAVWSGARGTLRFDIEADRFLYTMVRRIVSTVVRAAEDGGGSPAVRAALESRRRRSCAPPAPAHGLYLMRVRYPGLGWVPKERMHVVA